MPLTNNPDFKKEVYDVVVGECCRKTAQFEWATEEGCPAPGQHPWIALLISEPGMQSSLQHCCEASQVC